MNDEKKPRKPRAKKDEGSAEVRPDAAPAVPTAVAEFEPLAALVGTLRAQLTGVVYDLTNKDQERTAREDRRQCVTLRSQVAELHKRLKRPVIDRGRALDADLKKVTEAILEVETPIDEQIQALEAERERKAEERRQAEAAKAAAVRAEILRVFGLSRPREGRLDSEFWRGAHARIEAEPINAERFPDFVVEAQEAKCSALEWCAAGLAEAERFEAEQADLARQRAELAEQARIQREARKAEDEKRAAEERERRERIAAEEAELAQKRAAFVAEQQAAEARARAEREAAEALARQQREEALAAEARQKQEAEARATAERRALEAAKERWLTLGPTLLAALETVAEWDGFSSEVPGRVRDVVADALSAAGSVAGLSARVTVQE